MTTLSDLCMSGHVLNNLSTPLFSLHRLTAVKKAEICLGLTCQINLP